MARPISNLRAFSEMLSAHFQVRARPVVIFEDDGGKYTYQDFDGEVLLIPMGVLRERTRGLRFPSLSDLPGMSCDKTLVKLALLRQLVSGDPNHPHWYGGPLGLARDLDAEGLDLRLPMVGHQDMGKLPDTLDKWVLKERETDSHLSERIDRYLDELHRKGVLDRRHPAPRLSYDGGQVVLELLHAEREESS